MHRKKLPKNAQGMANSLKATILRKILLELANASKMCELWIMLIMHAFYL